MVSARGIAPAVEFSLGDLSEAQGTINIVDVDCYYDVDRYHLKGIGMYAGLSFLSGNMIQFP